MGKRPSTLSSYHPSPSIYIFFLALIVSSLASYLCRRVCFSQTMFVFAWKCSIWCSVGITIMCSHSHLEQKPVLAATFRSYLNIMYNLCGCGVVLVICTYTSLFPPFFLLVVIISHFFFHHRGVISSLPSAEGQGQTSLASAPHLWLAVYILFLQCRPYITLSFLLPAAAFAGQLLSL